MAGEPHLHRSSVVAGQDDATGEDKGAIDDIRTSYGMFLPKAYDDVTLGLEKRRRVRRFHASRTKTRSSSSSFDTSTGSSIRITWTASSPRTAAGASRPC